MSDEGPGMMPQQPPQGYTAQPPAMPPRPPQPGYGGGGDQYPVRRTNGLAVASMILGILWVCWIGSVLAVIFGHVALSQIKKSQETQQGRGFAVTGLILGYLGVATLILALLFGDWTWNFNVGS